MHQHTVDAGFFWLLDAVILLPRHIQPNIISQIIGCHGIGQANADFDGFSGQ